MSNISAEDFNEKYNLKNINLNSLKIVKEKDKIHAVEMVGKPKKAWLEVIRRFFKNPYNIAAFIVLLAVLSMAIIVPLVSRYSAEAPISPAVAKYRSLLGSSLTNHAVKMVVSDVDYNAMLAQQTTYNISGFSFDQQLFPSTKHMVEFRPWDYLNALDGKTFGASFVKHHSIVGTDTLGRDIWTRAWVGTGSSLRLAIIVVSVETAIGVAIGAYIGFHVGSWVDTVLMRVIDVIGSIPSLFWFMIILFIMPAGFWTMVIALIIIGWIGPVAATRMWIITVKDAEYISAAKAIGASKSRRIFIHALPAIMGKLANTFVRRIPGIIGIEAGLAFLGFSPNPDAATLGNIINEAKEHPEMLMFVLLPAIIMLLLTLSLQLIANGLHDALDPKIVRGAK